MAELPPDLMSQFPDFKEFEGRPAELASDGLKIESVELHPAQDRRRVVVGIVTTPTHRRLDLEIVILAPDDTVAAETCIVESCSTHHSVTMHLRPSHPSLTYTVKVGLFCDQELLDHCQAELTWPR